MKNGLIKFICVGVACTFMSLAIQPLFADTSGHFESYPIFNTVGVPTYSAAGIPGQFGSYPIFNTVGVPHHISAGSIPGHSGHGYYANVGIPSGAYGSPIVGYTMVPVYAPTPPAYCGQPHPQLTALVPGTHPHAGRPQPIICMVKPATASDGDADSPDIAVVAQTTEACDTIGGKVTSISDTALAPETPNSASDNN